MPRHRTPLSQAEGSGAVDHNPKRYADRRRQPKVDGPIGDPPNHFDDILRDYWNEIVAMVPAGVLTSADRILVEVAVGLLQKLRGGYITGVETGHLRACLGSMGCTPADRSKVTPTDEQEKTEDELDGFVQ